MTKLAYPKEENSQAALQAESTASNEAEQILHLKRLLVTLKQHYEKSLQQAHLQLQAEQNQRLSTQKEIKKVQTELMDCQENHEDELEALRNQQTALKELLKKAQDELAQRNHLEGTESNVKQERVEQLERVLPYLRDRTTEANLETEKLREELDEAQKKLRALEQELVQNKQNAQRGMEHLQSMLEEQKKEEDGIETVVSTTSSHYLRRELESIKRMMQGNEESKALEARYIEILNEKIGLEHQCKQLQIQLEHQSSNFIAFQEQLHGLEDRKKILESSLMTKEEELKANCKQLEELQARVNILNDAIKEKDLIQGRYELLKEEWIQMTDRLDEAVDSRRLADQQLFHLEDIAAKQEFQLQDFSLQLQSMCQEKESFESERNQLQLLLEECETRLKVAQQHLAKKVKEAALLGEKLEEERTNLTNFAQTIEFQKTQLAQLQASADMYQRQEKRLQDQLHEALKGTETQIVKWEEKYFRMYDKWQESENRIRDLKKFEEKHMQMQSLLANLGNFMGGAFNPSNALFHAGQEIIEKPFTRPFAFDAPQAEENEQEIKSEEPQEERYDLFGMRQPPEKYNPNLFS